MRRNLPAIASILQIVATNEAKGEPTVFLPERISDKDARESVTHFAPMLAANGFLRKVEAQADFQGMDCYRITWKGHCFLDLFDRYGNWQDNPPGSPMQVAAEIALLSLH